MHELKKLLDELITMDIEPGSFYIPEQVFDAGLTAEEIVLYAIYCRYKSEGVPLPGIDTLADNSRLKPGMVKITMAALTKKGITYD